MADIRNQSLRFIGPPFLISKREEYYDHRSADDMIIEILSEETAFDQYIYERVEQPCARLAADAAAVACDKRLADKPVHLVPPSYSRVSRLPDGIARLAWGFLLRGWSIRMPVAVGSIL
jgi:hypothetical protein